DSGVAVVNNVMYDWGAISQHYAPRDYYPWATLFYAGGRFEGPFLASVVGNKYIKGPTTPSPRVAIDTWSSIDGSRLYMSDNTTDGAVTPYHNDLNYDPRVSTPPVPLDGITIRPSSEVEAFVLANAGARPLDRDAVDLRIVMDVKNRTGSWISSQDQVGGWPNLAVNTRPLSVPSNANNTGSSGYTVLEEWLQTFDVTVSGTPPSPSRLRIVDGSH